MIAAFLLILLLLAALFVGAVIGRRFEAASQDIAGLLAVGERDTAICDAAENGWSL
jgi:hypothetical protein